MELYSCIILVMFALCCHNTFSATELMRVLNQTAWL